MSPGYTSCVWLTPYWSEPAEDSLLLAVSLFCSLLRYSLTAAVYNISSTSENTDLSHNAFVEIFPQSSLYSFHPAFARSSKLSFFPDSQFSIVIFLHSGYQADALPNAQEREASCSVDVTLWQKIMDPEKEKKKSRERRDVQPWHRATLFTVGMVYYSINLVHNCEDVNM